MIACTSPAGTLSETPLRIGLSATVAWRLAISSISAHRFEEFIVIHRESRSITEHVIHLAVRAAWLGVVTGRLRFCLVTSRLLVQPLIDLTWRKPVAALNANALRTASHLAP